MKTERSFKNLFLIAAIYDIVLGGVFCLFYRPLYNLFFLQPVPEPHIYFQVCAAFIAVTGLGFLYIYKNLYRNIDLVKIGIAMKVVYCLAAIWYATHASIPIVLAVFGVCDAVFIIFFVAFLRFARASGKIPR